jgi:hypothetical protein
LASLRIAQARDANLGPLLEGTLCPLHGGYAEDVLQLTVHLADPIGGGHKRSIQERCGYDHILDGPGKDWMWRTFMVDGGGDDSGLRSSFGEVIGRGSLLPHRGLASV